MAIVIYEKKSGKAIELNHSIDVKEWIATGKYTDKKPSVKPQRQEQPKQETTK